jgi:transcriptional regulator GlxA family with amidase domain
MRGEGYLEELSTLAYDLLLELRGCIAESSLPSEITQSLAFMRNHVESRMTNAQIASSAFKSVSRLCALYQQHLGVPPMECFIRMKMEHARILLTQTSESIARISDRLGYGNQAYFSRTPAGACRR